MKASLIFLVFFSITDIFGQHDYNFDPFGRVFSEFYSFDQNIIPVEQKREIAQLDISYTSKKSNWTSQTKYDTKGRQIEEIENRKKLIHEIVQYNANDKVIANTETRNGVLYSKTTYLYDHQNRLLEKLREGKKGKFLNKEVKTYGEGDCPLTLESYFKRVDKMSRRWEHSYYSDCDKRESVLKNGKGKVLKTWHYDCKKEGEILTPQKDVMQVCKWDEETELYFIKIAQNFNDKGEISKKVEKFYRSDTTLAERSFYNGSDQLLSRIISGKGGNREVTKEIFRNGKRIRNYRMVYLDNKKVLHEEFRKGKELKKVVYTYANGKLIKEETTKKGRAYLLRENEFEAGVIKGHRQYFKDKLSFENKFEFNDKGLLTKKEWMDKDAKVIAVKKYDYQLRENK